MKGISLATTPIIVLASALVLGGGAYFIFTGPTSNSEVELATSTPVGASSTETTLVPVSAETQEKRVSVTKPPANGVSVTARLATMELLFDLKGIQVYRQGTELYVFNKSKQTLELVPGGSSIASKPNVTELYQVQTERHGDVITPGDTTLYIATKATLEDIECKEQGGIVAWFDNGWTEPVSFCAVLRLLTI